MKGTPEDYERLGLFRMDNGQWTHADGDEHAARILAGLIPHDEAIRAATARKALGQQLKSARKVNNDVRNQ